MRVRRSGSVMQGGLSSQQADYGHLRMNNPVIGVVLNVYRADDPLNETSATFQDKRGTYPTARVMVVNDGTDAPTLLPNVLILPRSGTGHDDFSEEIPNGTTGTIDGTKFRTGYENVEPYKLNGDWCVVHFIGGSIHQPVMLSWFPHPGNRKDALTTGTSPDALEQNRRLAKRFQGTRVVMTSEGTLILDTSKANYKLTPDRTDRTANEKGGDVKVTVKKDRELEVNFNPPVFDENQPDFLWERKEVQQGGTREELATQLLMNQEFIKAVAGKVVEIAAQNGNNGRVYIGREATAQENFVLGQELKTLLSSILNELITHIHPIPLLTVVNAVPINPLLPVVAGPGSTTASPSASSWSNDLADVMAEKILSTWIFGQKDPP